MSAPGLALAAAGAAVLRRLPPETAHALTLRALELGLGPGAEADDPALATTVAGLRLPNPVGLAAGFDKDARVTGPLLRAGFGWVEAGTVTPLPQAGAPRPRLFRLRQDRAVINRLGFNNGGLDAYAARLVRRDRTAGVVVANIGANKDSADRIGDYVAGLERLWGLADGFTVNVSSPNTPGLRALQSAQALDELGGRLGAARARLCGGGRGPPVFLKVAPDLDEAEVEAIADRAAAHGFDALVVSNTTVSRPETLRGKARGEAGGLSGAPLFARSTAVLRLFTQALAARPTPAGARVGLIAAGGVASGADALAKLRAGASAVQVYTALVYGGPALTAGIKRDLLARLRAEGFRSVREAVGTE